MTALKEGNDRSIYFYTAGESKLDKIIPLSGIKENISKILFQVIHRAIYNNDYFFPPERTAFTQILTQISPQVSPEEAKKKNKKPSFIGFQIPDESDNELTFPYPIWNFMRTMTSITLKGNISQRIKISENEPSIKDYMEIADILEKYILQGNLELIKQEPSPLSKVQFQYSYDGKLDMPVVSSMVKELAVLILYLRYEATSNDLLIIDEPEMHLHPEAQIRMAEVLALMANKGLNIIITTHSPYIVDHLVNLIKAASRYNKDEMVKLFSLKNKDSFIGKEKVSVYLFEKGSVSDIMESDGHINWKTFSEVSERLSELYFKI